MIFVLSFRFLVFGTLMHHLLYLGEPVPYHAEENGRTFFRPSAHSKTHFPFLKKVSFVTFIKAGLTYTTASSIILKTLFAKRLDQIIT